MRHFKPPDIPPYSAGRLTVFIGGSIEMGGAEDWQKKLVERLSRLPYAQYIDLYNPRRDNWDPAWPNDYAFPPFKEQVDWELNRQNEADLLLYYFAGNTISPITLFELGLFHARKPVVGADPAYKRLGNLIVTDDHFKFDIQTGWEAFCLRLEQRLNDIARARGWLSAPPAPNP